MKVQFRNGARLGAQATRRSDAQARERRPPGSSPGGARHSPPKAGGGKDPLFRGGPFSAGIPAFGVIRTLEWQTPFAALRAPCLRPLKADGNEPPAALRAAVPTGGLYLSGHPFSWGRQLANEWRRRGCVGARPVAGGRRPEEEGGAGSELAEPHLAWWRPSRGASPFFLLPAMKLLPAHPRRRRHPEGRSAAEEARSALPSSTWMGTMLSSCRKQENHVSFFPGPSGVRGTEGPYLTNLLADPPGATNRRRVS